MIHFIYNFIIDYYDVLNIDINKKNYKQIVKILKSGMDKNVDATVKIIKLKEKQRR